MSTQQTPTETAFAGTVSFPGTPLVPRYGGMKHDQEKPRQSLVPHLAMREVKKVLEYGAQKYAVDNWREGFEASRLYDSTHRHLDAWWLGEECDKETHINHLAHAICGMLFLLELQMLGKMGDDRHVSRVGPSNGHR